MKTRIGDRVLSSINAPPYHYTNRTCAQFPSEVVWMINCLAQFMTSRHAFLSISLSARLFSEALGKCATLSIFCDWFVAAFKNLPKTVLHPQVYLCKYAKPPDIVVCLFCCWFCSFVYLMETKGGGWVLFIIFLSMHIFERNGADVYISVLFCCRIAHTNMSEKKIMLRKKERKTMKNPKS